MNLELKDMPAKVKPILDAVRRHGTVLAILLVVGIFCFLILRINQYASMQPSEEAVSEKLQGVRMPRVNQASLDAIEQLEDQNVEVQALFKQARENPFKE